MTEKENVSGLEGNCVGNWIKCAKVKIKLLVYIFLFHMQNEIIKFFINMQFIFIIMIEI